MLNTHIRTWEGLVIDNPADEAQVEAPIEVIETPETRRGLFANHAVVRHASEHFAVDFMHLDGKTGTLGARVFLTPSHFKRLVEAMTTNLARYEATFGPVPRNVLPLEKK